MDRSYRPGLNESQVGQYVNISCHIWYKLKKNFFAQIGSVIYHPESIFEEVPNIWTAIWNYTCGTCCDYFYLSDILQEMWPLPDVGDLYIILTRFSRRFWIWLSKFEILSLASAVTIFIFLPHYRECEPHGTFFSYPFLYITRDPLLHMFSMNLDSAHLSVKLRSAHLGMNLESAHLSADLVSAHLDVAS